MAVGMIRLPETPCCDYHKRSNTGHVLQDRSANHRDQYKAIADLILAPQLDRLYEGSLQKDTKAMNRASCKVSCSRAASLRIAQGVLSVATCDRRPRA